MNSSENVYSHVMIPEKNILRKLDNRKIRKLKGTFHDHLQEMYWNLWRQFGLTPEKVRAMADAGNRPSVADYAWTEGVEKAFYAHPKHAAFYKKLCRRQHAMTKGMWALQTEPRTFTKEQDKENERLLSARIHAQKTAETDESPALGIGAAHGYPGKDAGRVRRRAATARKSR
jgi:hypothetical protein